MDINLWSIGGTSYKGSDFPVVLFTQNPGRRSPDAHERRRKKDINRQWRGWTSWDASDSSA